MLEVSLQIRVRSRAVSQPATSGTPMRVHTNGPASSGLGEGLAGQDVLVPSRTSHSCGGLGAVHADTVASCTVFPSTHWCDWLPGYPSSAAWPDCVSEDAWLSTGDSPESVREMQRWDKTVTTNWGEKVEKNEGVSLSHF